MFIALKSFTNGTLTVSKGKKIEIKDNKLSKSLLSAGVIASCSQKDLSNAEQAKEIDRLNGVIAEMEKNIDVLTAERDELKAQIVELTTEPENSNETDKNEDEKTNANDLTDSETEESENQNKEE